MRLRLALSLLVLGVLPALAVPAAAEAGFRGEAVAWAVKQDGHRESGTTNCSARITRWQRDMRLRIPPCRPWCGALVHQAFLRAGVRLSARLIDPERSAADAVAGRRGLRRIALSRVRRGDLLFFAFSRGPAASHLAIARSRARGGRFATVEGNVGHRAVVTSRPAGSVLMAARVVR